MNMGSPVDLHLASLEKDAPALQAVHRQVMRLGIGLRTHSAPGHRLDVHRPVRLDGLRSHVGRQPNTPFTAPLSAFLAQQFCLCLRGLCVSQSSPPANEGLLGQPMDGAVTALRQTAALPRLDVQRPPFASGSVLKVFVTHRRFSSAAENPKWNENTLSRRSAETGRLQANRGWQDKSADGCRAHVVGWSNDFDDARCQHAGAFTTKLNPINGATASAGIRGNGDRP